MGTGHQVLVVSGNCNTRRGSRGEGGSRGQGREGGGGAPGNGGYCTKKREIILNNTLDLLASQLSWIHTVICNITEGGQVKGVEKQKGGRSRGWNWGTGEGDG